MISSISLKVSSGFLAFIMFSFIFLNLSLKVNADLAMPEVLQENNPEGPDLASNSEENKLPEDKVKNGKFGVCIDIKENGTQKEKEKVKYSLLHGEEEINFLGAKATGACAVILAVGVAVFLGSLSLSLGSGVALAVGFGLGIAARSTILSTYNF
ncbi:MAG: hypothetical protein LBP36_03305 [Oscillospiraceae bacterium]|jgi:hypothetical protein|nr:hypothetical protein [Oscillospiraceae bacterium]